MEIAALISALQDPSIYPERPAQVEVRQTHASVVFLSGESAYKLKKPVNLGFLNYSTLQRRLRMCHSEVSLNRRLAPDVYLAVVPVVETDGALRIDGAGKAIDYLVRMRRLRDEDSLAWRVDHDVISLDEVRAIARRIARFHQDAASGDSIDHYGSPAVIAKNVEENFHQTSQFVGTLISPSDFQEIVTASRQFLQGQRPLMLSRIAEGRIRDGHGDMRCEHVFLERNVEIIDCIEFNRRFRFGDVAADLAFLAMDLDAHCANDFADLLVGTYLEVTCDDLVPVFDFYRCYRAYVRAKVAAFRANDHEISTAGRTEARIEARGYFHRALRYARHDRWPALILVSGLTGTGKSVLAKAVGPAIGARVIASDPTRKRIGGLESSARRSEPIDTGLYDPAVNQLVYAELLAQAKLALSRGRSIILDATYRRRADRIAALDLARSLGGRFLLVECRTDDATIGERLARRATDPTEASDAGFDVYLAQKDSFERIDELRPEQHLVLDTKESVESQVAAVLAALD